MKANEKSQLNISNNTLILIGCDEERLAQGTYIIDFTFRQCVTHIIKNTIQDNACNTYVLTAPTDPTLSSHHRRAILPTKSFIESTAQNIKGNTGAPTYPASYQLPGPTCPPTSSNMKSASRT